MARLGDRFDDGAAAREARAALQPLESRVLRMVAVGQFKRGKSTLLNALLGEAILPSGVPPVTSVATLIRWAATPQLTVHHEDGTLRTLEYGRLADFVVEGRRQGSAVPVEFVEVQYPAPLLKDGIVLVDTPGIGSTSRDVTERAYRFLPSVDVALVVLSPDPPIGESEAEYIGQLASLTPHLLFVLNKIDRVAEGEWREALSFNRNVLATATGRDPQSIDILPVSARMALEDGDTSVTMLREHIRRIAVRKGAEVRDELADRRLRRTGTKLRVGLEAERRALDLEERELDTRIEGLRQTVDSLAGRTERAARAVLAAVDEIVGRAGEDMLAHARSKTGDVVTTLRSAVVEADPGESNASLATRFDRLLEEGQARVLDEWWRRSGPAVVSALLGEMTRAANDLAEARREAADWIQEAFGVSLPDEPRVGALEESRGFYLRVEGLTPQITFDLLRALLPRPLYRAWVRRNALRLAAQALEMGCGQVRGDFLYRARETARTFTSGLRDWALAGTDGLLAAVDRAASLRLETGRAADTRRRQLEDGIDEIRALLGQTP
ncbi:MAG: dynamin family protein [Gemmatimonadota bacterium]